MTKCGMKKVIGLQWGHANARTALQEKLIMKNSCEQPIFI